MYIIGRKGVCVHAHVRNFKYDRCQDVTHIGHFVDHTFTEDIKISLQFRVYVLS